MTAVDERAKTIGQQVLEIARENVRERVLEILQDEANHWPPEGAVRAILHRMAERIQTEVR